VTGQASYLYDGDGNLARGIVNGVVTFYPGRQYNREVDGANVTEKKFYTLGSTTVAVRTVQGSNDTLNWILGDHLGSASVTATPKGVLRASSEALRNADGTWNSEIKYRGAPPEGAFPVGGTAFGEVRASYGLTPTDYRYTGQLDVAELGLIYFVARFYDPYLNHWVQPDSIIPDPYNPLDWDRYTYCINNPIRYNDPSGHMIMVDDDLFVREDKPTGDLVIINSWGPGKTFTNPVEQAAANVVINMNSKYLAAMPENSSGFFVAATFETAAKKVGTDLGNYYTNFINFVNMAWSAVAGTRYTGSYNNSIPSSLNADAMGDPDCLGCGFQSITDPALRQNAQNTLELIDKGGPFPYKQDGAVFKNKGNPLPVSNDPSYYHEYTITTPGMTNRGTVRIIVGGNAEVYLTLDHYGHFIRIR